MTDGWSRRALLGRCAGAVGVGVTSATAGCQSFDGLLREGADADPLRTDVPDVTVPPRGEPWYRDWAPIPDVVGVPISTVSHVDYRLLRGAADRLSDRTATAVRNVARRRRDYLGLPPDSVDRVVRVADEGVVLLGGFSADAVTTTVGDSGYVRRGTEAGATVYTRDDARRALAVADGRVVWTYGDRAPDLVRTTLGAYRGTQPRFADSVPLVAELSDRLGSGLYGRIRAFDSPVNVGTGESDGSVGVRGQGTVVLPDGDALYVLSVVSFVEGLGPDPYSFPSRIRARFAEAEVTIRGPRVVVEGRVPLSAVEVPGVSGGPPRWPLVTWSFDLDADGTATTVTHAAGDPVPAAALTLSDQRGKRTGTQFADRYDTVTPGDAVTLDASDLTRLSLTWGPADRTMRTVVL